MDKALLKESIIGFVKNKPVVSIGIAAVAGILLMSSLGKKKKPSRRGNQSSFPVIQGDTPKHREHVSTLFNSRLVGRRSGRRA